MFHDTPGVTSALSSKGQGMEDQVSTLSQPHTCAHTCHHPVTPKHPKCSTSSTQTCHLRWNSRILLEQFHVTMQPMREIHRTRRQNQISRFGNEDSGTPGSTLVAIVLWLSDFDSISGHPPSTRSARLAESCFSSDEEIGSRYRRPNPIYGLRDGALQMPP